VRADHIHAGSPIPQCRKGETRLRRKKKIVLSQKKVKLLLLSRVSLPKVGDPAEKEEVLQFYHLSSRTN
jgi:hypothetical protein